jgi:hypothetical protein
MGRATTTVEELMDGAVEARRVTQHAITLAVREARAAGWSWDRMSAGLGGTPNGALPRGHGGHDHGLTALPCSA